jgi:hypothetical protein
LDRRLVRAVRLNAIQYLGAVDAPEPPQIGLRGVDQLDPEGRDGRS